MPSYQKRPGLVDLHPVSQKLMKKGHPWVTSDSFSKRFPLHDVFIYGKGPSGEREFLLLNDPSHPRIKARLWSQRPPIHEEWKGFTHELSARLIKAFEYRQQKKISEERSIFYLSFGEADFLPGLKIIQMGQGLLIQSYTHFWAYKEIKLKTALDYALKKTMIDPKWIIFQERSKQQVIKLSSWKGNFPRSIAVEEFGVNYQLNFSDSYDFGFYPDMSGMRKKLKSLFQESKSLLNLYSYTGAFSAFGLSLGIQEVVSVDLSKDYLGKLEHNLSLNKNFKGSHRSVNRSVQKAIEDFKASQQKFDLIISDPPSFSTDGRKSSKAFAEYKSQLPSLSELLNPGGACIIFLNTHSISRKKFENSIQEIIKPLKDIKIEMHLKLSEDCPVISSFPEGDYLKGLVLRKSK